jgi:hypothetical protein
MFLELSWLKYFYRLPGNKYPDIRKFVKMSEIEEKFNSFLEDVDNIYQSKKIPKFKVTLKGTANNISNLMDILIRKSLIKEDIYNYDSIKRETFFLPEEKNFTDMDKPRMIYERLKATINAFEYVSINIPESLFDFTEEYLENCRKLLEYFAFHTISSANNVNTRTIKELTDRIINGNDEIFKKVIQDNLKLLNDSYLSIRNYLEDITKFKKEEFKIRIRYEVFPVLPMEFTQKFFDDNQATYLKKLEDYVKINLPAIQFNRLWGGEAVKDCYSVDENEALKKLQSQYLPDSEKAKADTGVHSPREKLLKIVYSLANSKSLLEPLYFDFDYNLKIINNREKSFVEKFQDFLRKIMNISDQSEFYHIEYLNPSTKTIQKDIVNINEFMVLIKKKIALFSEILKSNSSVAVKINKGTEESLYKFLEDGYINLLLMKERIIGLDAELRLSTQKKLKSKFRNITDSAKEFEAYLIKVGEQRRRYIIEQEDFHKQKKK